MWQINLNQESRNYLLDSAPYVANLIAELVAFEQTVNGRPAVGMVDNLGEEIFLWGIVDHLVLFRRIEVEKTIRILLIKPA